MKKILIGVVATFGACFAAIASNQVSALRYHRQDLPEMNKPHILITKSDRKLELFDGKKLVSSYKIALGSSPSGDKEVEGDGKTPEGEFYIFIKNAESRFYLSLGISYPNKEDAQRGFDSGLISEREHDEIVTAIDKGEMPPQKTKLGGEIYIHGDGNLGDWTSGCIALGNSDIEELFKAVAVGTRVKILP